MCKLLLTHLFSDDEIKSADLMESEDSSSEAPDMLALFYSILYT